MSQSSQWLDILCLIHVCNLSQVYPHLNTYLYDWNLFVHTMDVCIWNEVSETYELIKFMWLGTCIPIGEHQQLGIAVEGNEGRDFSRTLDKVHYGFHFNFRVGTGSMVWVRARVVAGSRLWWDAEDAKWEQWALRRQCTEAVTMHHFSSSSGNQSKIVIVLDWITT